MTVEVRPLEPGDRPAWQPLWEAYLRFYRAELGPEVTEAAFARLSERRDGMAGMLAWSGAGAVGLAHVVVHPSTWGVAPSTYLEDLFVAPGARGTGAARALIDAVYAGADAAGAPHVYWHTQEYNAHARSLYDVVGRRTSFVVYER